MFISAYCVVPTCQRRRSDSCLRSTPASAGRRTPTVPVHLKNGFMCYMPLEQTSGARWNGRMQLEQRDPPRAPSRPLSLVRGNTRGCATHTQCAWRWGRSTAASCPKAMESVSLVRSGRERTCEAFTAVSSSLPHNEEENDSNQTSHFEESRNFLLKCTEIFFLNVYFSSTFVGTPV